MEAVGFNLSCTVLVSPVIRTTNNASSIIEAGFTNAGIERFFFTQPAREALRTLTAVVGNAVNTCRIVKTRIYTTFINVFLTQ